MKDQERAPIWEALVAHRDKQAASFHVPGHKGGSMLDGQVAAVMGGVYAIDFTEISGLDDLHKPEGVIAEAERLCAEMYGAERTHLLVGGSTVGNLALILAVCQPGDLLLVQRNVHKSVLNGLALAGARAVFIEPQLDGASGLPGGIRVDDAEAALDRWPEAVGLFLTDPNYYGIGMDLRPLVEAAHRRSVPVLVDAAHGAHFGFHPELPGSAVAVGADAVVHSTHKMLTAMTMGAMLHLQGSLLDQGAVARALTAMQSSSPSYPIMASLDLARRELAVHGRERLGAAIQVAGRIRAEIAKTMPWFHATGTSSNDGCGHGGRIANVAGMADEIFGDGQFVSSWTWDPLKLAIVDATGTLGGPELLRELEQEGCFPEMADPEYVLLAFGMPTGKRDADRLLEALSRISERYQLEKQELRRSPKNINNTQTTPYSDPIPFMFHRGRRVANVNRVLPGISMADEDFVTIQVTVEEAIGHQVAHQITPYPPGVPLLFPGETVTASSATRLQEWIASGSRIHGLNDDGTLTIMRRVR